MLRKSFSWRCWFRDTGRGGVLLSVELISQSASVRRCTRLKTALINTLRLGPGWLLIPAPKFITPSPMPVGSIKWSRWLGLVNPTAPFAAAHSANVRELVRKIDDYVTFSHKRPFMWTATADSIIATEERLVGYLWDIRLQA